MLVLCSMRDIYLKQASTQSLERDTERAGAALARESQVIERGVAHNGVLRVWCGTTFVADIRLLPLGTRVGVAEQEWLRGARRPRMLPNPTSGEEAANRPSVEELLLIPSA